MDNLDRIIYGKLSVANEESWLSSPGEARKLGIPKSVLSLRRGVFQSDNDVRSLDVKDAVLIYRALYIDRCGFTTIEHAPLIRQLIDAGLRLGLDNAIAILNTSLLTLRRSSEPSGSRAMRPIDLYRLFMSESILFLVRRDSMPALSHQSLAISGLHYAELLCRYIREAGVSLADQPPLLQAAKRLRNAARMHKVSYSCDTRRRFAQAASVLNAALYEPTPSTNRLAKRATINPMRRRCLCRRRT